MGDPPPHGGGEPPGRGCPRPRPTAPPGRIPPETAPGAFMSFLYFDRRFWNQIFTCNKRGRLLLVDDVSVGHQRWMMVLFETNRSWTGC